MGLFSKLGLWRMCTDGQLFSSVLIWNSTKSREIHALTMHHGRMSLVQIGWQLPKNCIILRFLCSRAPIDQQFSRESSPNPNLASDRALDHTGIILAITQVMLSVVKSISVLSLPLGTVIARVTCLCPLDDILSPLHPISLNTGQQQQSMILLLLVTCGGWGGSRVTDISVLRAPTGSLQWYPIWYILHGCLLAHKAIAKSTLLTVLWLNLRHTPLQCSSIKFDVE